MQTLWEGKAVKLSTDGVTRVEVINHCEYRTGREYTFRKDDILVEVVFQDDTKTLKVFIKDKND